MNHQAEYLEEELRKARAEIEEMRKRVCVPDVSTMARVLSDRVADARNIDLTDNWAMYGEEYIEDVQAMLAAAPAPVERVEQEAVAMLLIDDATAAESGDWDIEPIPTAIEKLARSGGAALPLYTTPQPAPTAAQDVAGLPFVRKILEKLERFRECAEDDEGVDIGRHWLDILTRLGLLNRVQRSPARWEMTAQADDALETAHQQRDGV